MININSKVEIDNINVLIGKKHILKDVNCKFEFGRIVVILGPNGSGKTSFLKAIKGLYKYETGKIIVDGKEQECLKEAVMVFDEPVLYGELTGREHLKFIRQLSKKTKGISEKEIEKLVKILDLSEYMDELIATYSLGTKKKIQLLCALVSKPEILLMDEYISGLDPQVLFVIKKVMKEYVKNNNMIILSTHMLDMAERFCDDVMLIKDGKIIGNEVVSIEKIHEHYENLEEYYIERSASGA